MTKLEVSTHSGSSDVIEVDQYDPMKIAEQINSNEIQAIALGNIVYSRIDIKNIKPIEE